MVNMSGRLQELRDRRRSVWEEAKEILDAAERNEREMSGEESEGYERRTAEVEALTREIDNREKAEELEQRFAAPQPEPRLNGGRPAETSPTSYDMAFKRYLKYGMRALDNSQARVLNDRMVNLAGVPGFEITIEGRALSTTGTAGGYMIPADFYNDMVRVMKAFGAVRRVARVITTDSGASMPYPVVDDTANVGAILAENVQVSEQDVAWTQKTLSAYMYTSKLVRSSLQLIQDSAFDVEAELRDMLGERVGRITNQHFTTGTGSGQPQGLTVGGTSGVTAASATAVTSDELISLAHSVDPAYRQSGRARWMMSDTALAAIRKLKDTTNQYLWQPSMQAGVPDSLFGYPIEINPDMPAMTTGLKPIAFGDFNEGYLIREVRGFQVLRLDERYADYLQVGFLGFSRLDGQVRNAAAFRLLTLA
jgi:HK97 family phage major capsid protein